MKLPTSPGVYLFKDGSGTVIYVGKAKNLRARVRSYFGQSVSSKVALLVKNIESIDHIQVDNEVEALLLENKLIKQYQPRFNVMAKDGKTFAYLKITDDPYPRIVSTRKVTKGGTYFGPFIDGRLRNELVSLVVQIFHVSTCKPGKRACLNYHLGLCLGTCVATISQEEYREHVRQAIAFLKGDYKPTLRRLQREMTVASQQQRYEVALEKRKQIEAIDLLKSRQKVDRIRNVDQHVIAMQHTQHTAKIVMFPIVRGVISGKREYTFEYEPELLLNFVKMYYSQRAIPHEIILSQPIWESDSDKQVLESYLSRLRGSKVTLTLPLRGEKRSLVGLALKNIGVADASLVELQRQLALPKLPRIIECFDISNLGREHVVAGMVQWVDGKPNSKEYRRFEIRSVEGQDDFASMREVVKRRYARLLREGKPLPDLIILDGGKGQLNAGLGALREVRVNVPMIALAKQEEEIYRPGVSSPFRFDKMSRPMLLVRSIRDSVHKFALSYNRKKRHMQLR